MEGGEEEGEEAKGEEAAILTEFNSSRYRYGQMSSVAVV
jgi:hypothetical protein